MKVKKIDDDMSLPEGSMNWKEEVLFILDLFSFLKNICIKRWMLLPIIMTSFLCLGAAMVMFLPKKYVCTAVMLVKKNSHMPSLTYPMRTILEGIDKPLASAEVLIMDEDLLKDLIHQTNLLNIFAKERSLLFSMKDRLMGYLFGISKEDKLKMLIETLKKNIQVKTNVEELSIRVTWGTAATSKLILETVIKLFLKARYKYEVDTISDTVGILKSRVMITDERIEKRLQELRLSRLGEEEKLKKLKDQDYKKSKTASNLDLQDLKATLLEKRSYLENIERAKRQKVAELQVQLNQLKSILNEKHPDILELENKIETLISDKSDVESIKKQEQNLLAEFQRRGGVEADLVVTQGGSLDAAFGSISKDDLPSFEKDEMITYARGRLRIDMDLFEDLNKRYENAQIELETAKEAFKYRYNLVSPPQLPKKPSSPKSTMLLIGSLFMSLVVWFSLSILLEIMQFKVSQNWQPSRFFGLKSLGEINV